MFAITIVSIVIDAFAVINIATLTAVTYISNIGTFLLYGMMNLIALVAFSKHAKRNPVTTILVPVLGAAAKLGILVVVIVFTVFAGGSTMASAVIAIGFSVVWLLVGVVYFNLNSKKSGQEILLTNTSQETAHE